MNQSLEGCIQLMRNFLKLKDISLSPPPMSDIIIMICAQCRPAVCRCRSLQADREQASSSVTEAILKAPFIEQHWVTIWELMVVWQWQTHRGLCRNCLHPYLSCRTVNPIIIASSSSSSSSEMDSCCYLAAIWSLPWSWPSPWAIIAAS